MRPLLHPDAAALTLTGVLHALSDPARLTMFRRIAGCESLSCGAVCAAQPRSTLSFNLRVLREAGLIRSERRGKEVVNSARRADVDRRFPGLLDAVLRAAEDAMERPASLVA